MSAGKGDTSVEAPKVLGTSWDAVIAEASGDSYRQEFGRVSSMTGLPAILGWPGHENQWRGKNEEQSRRMPDLDAIFT